LGRWVFHKFVDDDTGLLVRLERDAGRKGSGCF
jgi:hypothetical protein